MKPLICLSDINAPSLPTLYICFVGFRILTYSTVKIGGAMPFLHGFRRIIYEYQPLVDAVMCVIGLKAADGSHDDR